MRKVRLILPLLFLIFLSYDVVQGILSYNSRIQGKVLSSPHGLALYPVSPKIQNYFYFHSLENMPEYLSSEEQALSFYFLSPILATILIYFMTSMLLFLFARIRKLEKGFLVFTLFLISNLLFFFDFLTLSKFSNMFYLTSLIINIPYLYLFRAILGFSLKPRFYFFYGLVALLIFYFTIPKSKAEEIFFFRLAGFIHFLFLAYSIFFFIRKIKFPGPYSIINSIRVRAALGLALIVTVAFPGLSYLIATYFDFNITITKNVLFFVPSIFPVLFFFFALRNGIIYFEIPVSGSFIRFSYFMFFLFLFWFTIGFHLVQIPYRMDSIELHLGLAIAFMILLETMRGFIYSTLQKSSIVYRTSLLQSFHKITNSNNPRNVAFFLHQLDRIVKTSLNISWMRIVLKDNIFPGWNINYHNVHMLSSSSPLWNQMNLLKKAISYPYFTGVASAIVKDFLQKQGAFIMIAYQNFPAMILLSEKKNQMPFNTDDVYFMRSFLKQTEPFFQNYQFLITNMHLRKQERELELVSRIQKKILPEFYRDKYVHYSGLFRPSQLVTGDYLDLVKIRPKNYLIILGDVSGHGLGSAYIMSILRTIIRGSFQVAKESLRQTFIYLNEFLGEEYQGSDFMTLFGMNAVVNGTEIKLNYINAGQHAAVVYLKSSQRMVYLKENQRVLGVIATDYRENSISFNEDIRIFLYSDGTFETVKKNGAMIGEKNMRKWIKDSVHLKPDEQKDHLYNKIMRSASENIEMDDISIMVIDINRSI